MIKVLAENFLLQLLLSLRGLQVISKWVIPQGFKWKSFLFLYLFQDCGRESRHMPVVSAGLLLFLLETG